MVLDSYRPVVYLSSMSKPLTHPERTQRRRDIANFVRRGGTIEASALKWGVTVVMAKASCQEHGVPFEKFAHSKKTDRLLGIVAALIAGYDTQARIGGNFDVDREYVGQVLRRCVKMTIPIHKRYRTKRSKR